MSLVTRTLALLEENAEDRIAYVREAYQRNPRQMTIMLARELGLPEVMIVRTMPEDLSVELDAARWEALLRSLEAVGRVHVIVSNAATTIECVGSFGGFSQGGGFFNVQSGSLDMHIRHAALASVFAVRKPSHLDGHATLSIQFFDPQGTAAFKVFLTFGGSEPSPEKEAEFERLISEFRLAAPEASLQ